MKKEINKNYGIPKPIITKVPDFSKQITLLEIYENYKNTKQNVCYWNNGFVFAAMLCNLPISQMHRKYNYVNEVIVGYELNANVGANDNVVANSHGLLCPHCNELIGSLWVINPPTNCQHCGVVFIYKNRNYYARSEAKAKEILALPEK